MSAPHRPTAGEDSVNQYTVRYQLDGEEFTDRLEAENAASAARLVEDRHFADDERFELLEVQLIDEAESEAPTDNGD